MSLLSCKDKFFDDTIFQLPKILGGEDMPRVQRRISRREFLGALSALPALAALPARATKRARETRIAFGSCADQTYPQPIWPAIAATDPALFIFGGDNVYADTEDPVHMQNAYNMLAEKSEYQNFRAKIPIIATWDDHDYGANDTGANYKMKHESKEIFLDFFGDPADSPRRHREGVYQSYTYGKGDELLQIILLDLRWFQTKQTMLGEEQWKWLKQELQKPARVRLVLSSLQFISDEHEWEKWSNLPHEKLRFLKLLDDLEIDNLLVLSGDMHFGEISCMPTPQGRMLYDFTASGLNYVEDYAVGNRFRVTLYDETPHFGLVNIDWDTLILRLELRNEQGTVVRTHEIQMRSPESS